MTQRLRVRVRGRVQGVGFRYFTVKLAERIGVTGFASNESDGTVLCEAQGSAEALAEFLAQIRRGPRFGRVDAVESAAIDPRDDEVGFDIRR